ncbi:MAG: TetR/AcrR family transcriptional regulator [Deltaproteobacteria bacterium]|nr:TetR/AcrR family transcriptional regulator [Deltaproteobacteria bacterium]
MKDSDKRGKIMQTALELFAEQGFHGVPMTMIAQKASVAIGTIYLYFTNKESLINEVFLEMEKTIIATIQDELPTNRPIRERFLHVTRVLIKYFINHPLQFRYMEQYMNSPFGISRRRDAVVGKYSNYEILSVIFEEGITHQILKDLPIGMLYSVGIGSLMFLIRDHILGFVTLDENSINQVTEACWDGIKRYR